VDSDRINYDARARLREDAATSFVIKHPIIGVFTSYASADGSRGATISIFSRDFNDELMILTGIRNGLVAKQQLNGFTKIVQSLWEDRSGRSRALAL
jgi:hypothetical protein